MTTIHLTDAQRDTFAACGLIVIDGGRCGCGGAGYFADRQDGGYMVECMCGGLGSLMPEGWRILTEPCDTCGGEGWLPNPARECRNPDCVGGRRVVTLTATCPKCKGSGLGELLYDFGNGGPIPPCWQCEHGVVTLGRFTIPALLPGYDTTDVPEDEDPMAAWDDAGDWVEVDRDANAVLWWHSDRKIDGAYCTYLPLDPPPRPGQFIARPERVG